jgi:ABC-type transport system substrate-binding protein
MAVAGPGYLPLDQLGDNAQWWKLNLGNAKQMLAAAGYPNGFSVDYNDDTTIAHTTVGEQMVANMAKIGIKLTIKRPEHAVFSATTGRGDYSGMGVSQIQLYDPDDFFSADLLPGTARNVSHVNDPMVSDLVGKQRTELDPNKRLDIIHELVKYLAGQVYVLTYPQLFATSAAQPFVKNYSARLGYQPTLMVTWLDR